MFLIIKSKLFCLFFFIAIIYLYIGETNLKYGRVITRLNRKLTHPDRYRETELGDLFSDILKESLGLDIMLLGSGSIRKESLGPIVTLQDLKKFIKIELNKN